MSNLNDSQETPTEKAKRLGVPLIDSKSSITGVCSKCGKTLYNNQQCSCFSKKEWL